jgi:hypothetical protein
VKEQVLKSPFIKKDFLDLASQIYDTQKLDVGTFAISQSSIINIGSREIVDYRPSISIDSNEIKKNNILDIKLDSLHFFQVQDLVDNLEFESLIVKKSDICVNLLLPISYEEYLQNLTKKNRHELKRKKRKFADVITSAELNESKEKDIFDIFVSQHKQSEGDKGQFMTDKMESYFEDLLRLKGWKIYYLETENGVISTAFCYENTLGCYLYNSSRNYEFNSLNPGIVINDLIIQKLISEKKSFFDFLKGTERYKYDLGGKSVQLYDLVIKL